jgi:hypothetical protein
MSNFYQHEREEQIQGPINLVWPLADTGGFTLTQVLCYMNERNLDWKLADANGWYISRNAGDCFLRIVIPAVVTKPKQVYWQARTLLPSAYIRYQSPKGPREGALIYIRAYPAFDDKLIQTSKVVVVEGPMDALAAAMCGYDAIALMGINPGEKALTHLKALVNKRPALVLLDGEPEATKAAHNITMELASAGGRTKVATLLGIKDLAAASLQDRYKFLDMYMGDLA